MARVLSLWIFYSLIGKSVLPCFQGHHTIVSRIHSFRSNCTTRSRSNSSYGFNSLSKRSSSHLPSLTAPGIQVLKDLFTSLDMDRMSGVPAFFLCLPHKTLFYFTHSLLSAQVWSESLPMSPIRHPHLVDNSWGRRGSPGSRLPRNRTLRLLPPNAQDRRYGLEVVKCRGQCMRN